MFSNLRVEGGENNHLFLPQLDIFPFLKDIVWIRDAKGQKEYSLGLNKVDFRRRLHEDYKRNLPEIPSLPLSIYHNGKEYQYENIFDDKIWLADLEWYLYFLDFREIQADQKNPNRCRL